MDKGWNLISANPAALGILSKLVSKELLIPPINVLHASLHPQGLAPHIKNFAEYSAHLLTRLHRAAVLSGDAALIRLHDELKALPRVTAAALVENSAELLFVPLHLELPDGTELKFFSTVATFGTALDVTLSELAIEAFFPADDSTRVALR